MHNDTTELNVLTNTTNDTDASGVDSKMDSTQPDHRHPAYTHRARNGVVPLGSLFVVLLSVLFSLLFIFSISLAFVGVADKNFFLKRLEGLAKGGDGVR